MHITIRLFARHREIAGRDRHIIELPDGASVGDAYETMCAEFPSIGASGRAVAFAVNRSHVDRTASLADGDELAILPPVAGG